MVIENDTTKVQLYHNVQVLKEISLQGYLAVTEIGTIYVLEDGTQARFITNGMGDKVLQLHRSSSPITWQAVVEGKVYLVKQDKIVDILEATIPEQMMNTRLAFRLKVLKELDNQARNIVNFTLYTLGVA
jgi:hypothetical protein